ncbi:MAG: helix-turn-helix transcriptional regulator [Clostridia bacterium]|nr:helix-turn-helix transcriptional regulator [Clostridia bacterium]
MASRLFGKRLQCLRINKGVDQQTMSHDLAMSKNYVYNIESGYAYPSMTQFFAICEYLDVAPYEFMKFGEGYTTKQEELLEAVTGFSESELEQVIAFAKEKRK